MWWYRRTIACNLDIKYISTKKKASCLVAKGHLQNPVKHQCNRRMQGLYLAKDGVVTLERGPPLFFLTAQRLGRKANSCRAGSGWKLGGDRKRAWIEGEGIKIIKTLGLMIHRVDEMTCDATWKMMVSFSWWLCSNFFHAWRKTNHPF